MVHNLRCMAGAVGVADRTQKDVPSGGSKLCVNASVYVSGQRDVNQKLYGRLCEVARRSRVIGYGEAAPLVGLDMAKPGHRRRMYIMLEQISRHEHALGRPLLSAVVIHLNRNTPGNGFFTLATELRLFRGRCRLTYFVNELRRVHDYWAYP